MRPRGARRGRLTPLVMSGRRLRVLDQLALPARERWLSCRDARSVARAIRDMNVRGAPAIGVAAGYGLALEALRLPSPRLLRGLEAAARLLRSARPTAVNLMWAVDRVMAVARKAAARTAARRGPEAVRIAVPAEARAIESEDLAANLAMGRLGAALLKRRMAVLTHCNTGALATAGHGTALGVIRTAYAKGRVSLVYVDETRPYLQGARLTAWELKRDRIPFVLITDNMAGHFMKLGKVGAVLVGADRVAANGDFANKIGTYSLAVLAKAHGIPFYAVAPTSTVDLGTRTGGAIPIEERSSAEVTRVAGREIAPKGTRAAHPAFDVTPARLVTAIVTEAGVARAPYRSTLSRLLRKARAGK